MDENAGAVGCAFLVVILVFTFLINPACYGGAVQNIFGIDDMGYWSKVLGGLSGLGIPFYFASEPLAGYFKTPPPSQAP